MKLPITLIKLSNFLRPSFLVLLLSCFTFSSAHATIYKCIENGGVVVYSAVQKEPECKLLKTEDPEDVIKGIENGFSYYYMGLSDLGINNPNILGAKIHFEALSDKPILYNQLIPYVSRTEQIIIDCKDKKYALSHVELYGDKGLTLHEYTAYPRMSQRFMRPVPSSSSYEDTVNYVCKNYYSE